MIEFRIENPARRLIALFATAAVCVSLTTASAQDRRNDSRQPTRTPKYNDAPSLSEATAILESEVRDLYKEIEPANDSVGSPNELVAYADLRSLRLYTGAIEVAGWTLEQAFNDYTRYNTAGAYRMGRNRVSDPAAQAALEQYLAYRETVRTLLFRVRTTAVAVEHQVSFCDRSVQRQWEDQVLPALRDTIAATDPMLIEEYTYRNYGRFGENTASVVRSTGGGIPSNAVDVVRSVNYRPYDGQGNGQGRFFEIRAYGGPVYVQSISFRSHENTFGVAARSNERQIEVNKMASPDQPLFVAVNRGRWADISDLEITWEPGDRGRRTAQATIDLVEDSPEDNSNNSSNNNRR